jgi:hypothetical protein
MEGAGRSMGVARMNYPSNLIPGIFYLLSDLCFLSSDMKLRAMAERNIKRIL